MLWGEPHQDPLRRRPSTWRWATSANPRSSHRFGAARWAARFGNAARKERPLGVAQVDQDLFIGIRHGEIVPVDRVFGGG